MQNRPTHQQRLLGSVVGIEHELAARMEHVRDQALQKIAEAFARRSAHQQERAAALSTRRQPCKKSELER